MLREIHLKNVGPGEELSFEFNERYNLLTGDNGVGKSFILDVAWWAASNDWVGHRPRPRVDGLDSSISCRLSTEHSNSKSNIRASIPEQIDLFGTNLFCTHDSDFPLTVFARSDGSFSIWDPVKHASKQDGSYVPPTSHQFSLHEVWNGKQNQSVVELNGLLRDVVTWQLEHSRPYEILVEALKVLSPSKHEILSLDRPDRLDINDARRVPTLKMPYGTVPLPLTSSGIRQIFSLAYLLVWAVEEHLIFCKRSDKKPARDLLILVDEIEAHLHPIWQRKILVALTEAISCLQSKLTPQILAVTHSPLVLASVESVFDSQSDCLFNLELEGTNVIARKLDWRARGDVASWLTSEVFNLGEARSIEAEEAIQLAQSTVLNPKATAKDYKSAHESLQRVLGDTDPFWVKWVARAERAGFKP